MATEPADGKTGGGSIGLLHACKDVDGKDSLCRPTPLTIKLNADGAPTMRELLSGIPNDAVTELSA